MSRLKNEGAIVKIAAPDAVNGGIRVSHRVSLPG